MTVSDQLVMSQGSLGSLSTTYRVQVPFGAVPSKVDRLTFPDGVGAGDGKSSGLPTWFVGW